VVVVAVTRALCAKAERVKMKEEAVDVLSWVVGVTVHCV
jgi:hypothetical protein